MFDTEYLIMIVKLLIFLPIILFLIYASLKYGGSKLGNTQDSKMIRILKRVPMTKDTTLIVVKIGYRGFVMVSSANKTETVMELDDEQLAGFEKESDDFKNKNSNTIKKVKNGIILNCDMIKNFKNRLKHKTNLGNKFK